MTLIESLVVFGVSLAVGAIGIHLAALVIIGESSVGNAVWTALIGALVLAVAGFFLGWIPLLGPMLTLFAWIWVINSRYPGSWLQAAGIGASAWVAALLVLYVLAVLGVTGFTAIGVPGA